MDSPGPIAETLKGNGLCPIKEMSIVPVVKVLLAFVAWSVHTAKAPMVTEEITKAINIRLSKMRFTFPLPYFYIYLFTQLIRRRYRSK